MPEHHDVGEQQVDLPFIGIHRFDRFLAVRRFNYRVVCTTKGLSKISRPWGIRS
jgi:hypothetical protein